MRSFTIKRLAAATIAGGALTLAPFAMPAANAAPAECPNYAVTMTTQTSVRVSPSNLNPGQTFTATATVTTAGGVPVTGGSVTFEYRGLEQTDSTVGPGGTFSVTFQGAAKKGKSPVTATFSGQCFAGSVASDSSSDKAPVIAGVSASTGNGGGSGAGIGGVSGSAGGSGGIAGLASTGLDTQTQLFGLLGVGMVTVGGLSLMVHRRRTQS